MEDKRPFDQASYKSRDVHEWQGHQEESQQANPQDKPPQYFSENLPHTKIEPTLPLRKAAKLRVGMAVMLAGTCREAGCTELRFSRQQPEQVFISFSKKRRITKIVQPGTSAWSAAVQKAIPVEVGNVAIGDSGERLKAEVRRRLKRVRSRPLPPSLTIAANVPFGRGFPCLPVFSCNVTNFSSYHCANMTESLKSVKRSVPILSIGTLLALTSLSDLGCIICYFGLTRLLRSIFKFIHHEKH
ncbi:Uncharacterized protein Fot_30073 [Forsythia ovata]|uniref:Uncharacterized protein n=1 Tax=Forsythia ovata TaxID=205694 RepID=A0ABD1TTN7_9LAMI